MQIYTTPETRLKIEALAKLQDLTMSTIIRKLVDAEYKRLNLVAVTPTPMTTDGRPVQVAHIAYVRPTAQDVTAELKMLGDKDLSQ